jgi:uncharacterized protein DUF3421
MIVRSYRWLGRSLVLGAAVSAALLLPVAPTVARAECANGGFSWVPAMNGAIPQGAVAGGAENGHPLVICHAVAAMGVHPGKVVASNCNFGYGGQEMTVPQYEVLVGPPGHWIAAAGGAVPPGAVSGGFEDGHPLFICRTHFGTGVHPGKVVANNCNIGYGGKEVTVPQYEVLVP